MTELLFGLSVLLLLVALGCFIIGLIHPRAFAKLFGEQVARKHILAMCIPALVIATLFAGAFAPPVEDATIDTRTEKRDTVSQQQHLVQQQETEQEALLQQQAAAAAEKAAQEQREREQAAQAAQAAREAATVQQPTPPPPAPTAPQPASVVKKSRTNICHAPGTTYYSRTIHYISFDTLEACLNSGGRLPKR